jgi:hypothetical protein
MLLKYICTIITMSSLEGNTNNDQIIMKVLFRKVGFSHQTTSHFY